MITNIINFFQRIYAENPSVAAILGVSSAGLLTSIGYLFRENISNFFYWIKKQFTTSLMLSNSDGLSLSFETVLKWLKKYNNLYTRSLQFSNFISPNQFKESILKTKLQYGLGNHLIFFNRRPIWVSIREDKIENSKDKKMTIWLTILGRKHDLFYRLFDRIYTDYMYEINEHKKNKTVLNIFDYIGIERVELIHKRGFNSVYLPDNIEFQLKHNISRFLSNRALYFEKGIPYHYGMILYGPPGTGKTSIIKAIASEFDFDISLIDPLKFDITRLSYDEEHEEPTDKVQLLVIEDIDLIISSKRGNVEDIEEKPIYISFNKEDYDRFLAEQESTAKYMDIRSIEGYECSWSMGSINVWEKGWGNRMDRVGWEHHYVYLPPLKMNIEDDIVFWECYRGESVNEYGDRIDNVVDSYDGDVEEKKEINSGGKKALRELMNAIDGLNTKENFIIIATTNSIESLDPALIRPGRFDTMVEIGYVNMEVFNKVMNSYFGKTVNGVLKNDRLTVSKLQVDFLLGKTYEDFVKEYINLSSLD